MRYKLPLRSSASAPGPSSRALIAGPPSPLWPICARARDRLNDAVRRYLADTENVVVGEVDTPRTVHYDARRSRQLRTDGWLRPEYPLEPVPATVEIIPAAEILRMRAPSSRNTFPRLSVATSAGPINSACCAGPPSPRSGNPVARDGGNHAGRRNLAQSVIAEVRDVEAAGRVDRRSNTAANLRIRAAIPASSNPDARVSGEAGYDPASFQLKDAVRAHKIEIALSIGAKTHWGHDHTYACYGRPGRRSSCVG